MFRRPSVLIFMFILTSASIAESTRASTLNNFKRVKFSSATSLPMGKRTFSPIGHIEFCKKYPSQCQIHANGKRSSIVKLRQKTWNQLVRVNKTINRSIRPRSDQKSHGQLDVWSLAGKYGDCEDYALRKRKVLIEWGWPSSAVIIATAKDNFNRPHAVLIARTDHGDFVLDNLNRHILPWNKVPYTWNKRQSSENPKVWMSFSRDTKKKQRPVVSRESQNRIQKLLRLANMDKTDAASSKFKRPSFSPAQKQ